jgi:hypothetical protein
VIADQETKVVEAGERGRAGPRERQRGHENGARQSRYRRPTKCRELRPALENGETGDRRERQRGSTEPAVERRVQTNQHETIAELEEDAQSGSPGREGSRGTAEARGQPRMQSPHHESRPEPGDDRKRHAQERLGEVATGGDKRGDRARRDRGDRRREPALRPRVPRMPDGAARRRARAAPRARGPSGRAALRPSASQVPVSSARCSATTTMSSREAAIQTDSSAVAAARIRAYANLMSTIS